MHLAKALTEKQMLIMNCAKKTKTHVSLQSKHGYVIIFHKSLGKTVLLINCNPYLNNLNFNC